MQVIGLGLVELERAGKGIENLGGDTGEVPALHPRVILGIDVLVNNAGYGYTAAVEEGEDEAVARLFATDFFGPVALIKAALPGMRHREKGLIVNISSVGARITIPGGGYYSARSPRSSLPASTATARNSARCWRPSTSPGAARPAAHPARPGDG